MNETLTQLGVGGILVILVLREVFGFLKARGTNGKGRSTCDECASALKELLGIAGETKRRGEETTGMVSALYKLHDVRDAHGQPVWYAGSLTDAVRELSANLKAQAEILRDLRNSINSLNGQKRQGGAA